MVIDDQNALINRISSGKGNFPSKKIDSDLPKNLETFNNFLKKKMDINDSDTGVILSGHAKKRLEERNLTMDGDEFLKIRDGINKLKQKGGKDSLIVTNQAAYIVDVDKQTVVTAMDKNDMAENVFTKIDSTLFIN